MTPLAYESELLMKVTISGSADLKIRMMSLLVGLKRVAGQEWLVVKFPKEEFPNL